jgi:hypothetical protein
MIFTQFIFLCFILARNTCKPLPHQPDDSNVSVHSDDSNVDNTSVVSEQPPTPTSENGRVRPSRPAPSIPTGLSRSNTRRLAPLPPTRLPTTEVSQSRGSVVRQNSTEDNAAYTVRKKDFFLVWITNSIRWNVTVPHCLFC